MRSIGTPVDFPSSFTRTAFRMGGSVPSGNSMSRTGPITWTTFPILAIASSFRSVERRGARNDFDELLGDPRLSRAVVGQGQGVDHVAGILRGRIHRGHPRAVFRSRRLEEQ